MKVVCTIIAGPGTETTVGKAIQSAAPFTDEFIVLPNATPEQNELIIDACGRALAASEFAHSGGIYIPFRWANNFAAARNCALVEAIKCGADWCLWIDTDEWFEVVPVDAMVPLVERGQVFRETLSSTRHGALMMAHASGSYTQPRVIRLPTDERWEGRTHECFPAFKVGQRELYGLRFNEGQKTPDQLEAKFRRDETILTEEVTRNALDARSWFYLGETKRNLGDVSGAIRSYDRRAMLKGWPEESAWACYRAAQCLAELEHYEPAIERCCTGLGLHAGVAELAWLAGWCNYKLGRFEQAIHWSQMAIIGGEYKGAVHIGERIGFKYPPALYEAPFGVLKHAARELGKEGLMQLAHHEFARALAAREERGLS